MNCIPNKHKFKICIKQEYCKGRFGVVQKGITAINHLS